MTKTFKTLAFLMCAGALTLASCKKTSPDPDPVTPTNNNNNNTASTPAAATPATPGDADGVMIAIRMNSGVSQAIPGFGTFTTYLKLDIGYALFPTTAGGTTYADAGNVTLNTTGLDKASDNKYSKVQQTNQPDFGIGSQVKWNVAGNASVQGITNAMAANLPMYDTTYFAGILTNNTITKANGLSFSLSSKLTGATDSVYVIVVGGGSSVFQKAYASTVGTVNISASQLSGLSNTTTGQFQITPYRITNSTFSGKKYYFISEQAYVKTGVTIN